MADYVPVQHEDHYIERDSSSNPGLWVLAIVVLVALLLLLFRFNVFGRGSSGNTSGTNVNGTVNTPSGTYQGSGSVTH